MEKKNYIQPEMGTIILPLSSLMIPSSPGEDYNPLQGAPQRRLLEEPY